MFLGRGSIFVHLHLVLSVVALCFVVFSGVSSGGKKNEKKNEDLIAGQPSVHQTMFCLVSNCNV